MPRYECDKCGACCKGHLIVETDSIYVLREPRLIDADPHHRGKTVLQMVNEIENDFKAVLIACGRDRPCPFLNAENHCGIYPTRPNCCVGLQPGDEQCQESRAAEGLPELQPLPDSRSLASSCSNALDSSPVAHFISHVGGEAASSAKGAGPRYQTPYGAGHGPLAQSRETRKRRRTASG